MKLYPESAVVQLEFDKVRSLLTDLTKTAYGKEKAEELRLSKVKSLQGKTLIDLYGDGKAKQIIEKRRIKLINTFLTTELLVLAYTDMASPILILQLLLVN
jgi:hypothetical protein